MNDSRWAQGKLEFLKFFEYVFPFGQSGSFWRVEFLPVTLVQVPTTQVVKTFCSQQSIKVGDHLFLWIHFPIWKEWLFGKLSTLVQVPTTQQSISIGLVFFALHLIPHPNLIWPTNDPKCDHLCAQLTIYVVITETLPASILIKGWG